jgi:hypothetical protein
VDAETENSAAAANAGAKDESFMFTLGGWVEIIWKNPQELSLLGRLNPDIYCACLIHLSYRLLQFYYSCNNFSI